MANVLTVEIATPDRLLFHDEALDVEIPAAEGMVGILPGHAPFFARLGTGTITGRSPDGTKRCAAISGGFVEVSNDHVRVLAERAEAAREIDVARAEAALKRANERLLNPLPGVDVARALNAAKRAQARLDAVKIIGANRQA